MKTTENTITFPQRERLEISINESGGILIEQGNGGNEPSVILLDASQIDEVISAIKRLRSPVFDVYPKTLPAEAAPEARRKRNQTEMAE